MAVTKRAGRKKVVDGSGPAGATAGRPQVKKAAFETAKKKEVGVSDLTLISKITNEAINDNLKKRFEHGEIYTYIGHVLVSVNPFRDLGIYRDEILNSYRGKNRLEMSPHVFAVAESAYYNMKAYKENQCVIISGESGAGKTEAAKRIMQYIANVSEGNNNQIQQTKDMVLATNPLLESFGNAKTLRNNNSSRFGKYLELQFNSAGEPVGANITNYLLEKSRVVSQIVNERNFHIFYQYTKAASSTYRTNFGIQEPQTYLYLNKSKCFDVQGIDDHAEFADTLNAMKIIGLSQDEQDNIFRMLSLILWLGNVTFREDDNGNATVADQSVVDFAAYLLEVEAHHLNKALSIRIMETSRGGRRGSVYEVPLNIVQASAVRDALAKAVYFNLFDWIVNRVNVSLKARGAITNSIGILDIYGFEIFEKNSFEQLCINYVNEKLQQIFIQLTLKTEQEEYEREQIKWTPISYFDNKVVCDLIEEKRPPGVFAALNDACATAHADSGAADSTFVQRLNALSNNQHFQPRQGAFVIKHYAGDVNYSIDGMTDKNKDQLLKDLLNLVAESTNPFTASLFPNQVNQDDKRRPPTAGDKIKASANDLVATLMKCSPSYIRTIKPNDNKSPTEYNNGNVMHQIKYLGLQENVRIRRAGFAYRSSFDRFVERFYLLSPKTSYAGDYVWKGDSISATKQILKDTGIPAEEYQMGVTKAFIKTPETLFALEKMRDRYWHNQAAKIQRAWRAYVRYRVECAIKIQRFWRRMTGGLEYLRIRDAGHQLLGGRKERRRFSLVGYRRFHGDYLGFDNKGGAGEVMRNSARLPTNEKTLFSCKAELLVTKFGRSSKPSPRTLVLTNKSVYIVVQAMVNNQLQISAERTIGLGAIRFVSCSNLKDDWFALGVGSPQEPDPLLNCVFKTEFFTHLKKALPSIEIRIGDTVQYNKKPGKLTMIKCVKDPNVPRDDLYKSGAIHTGQGEPPNSQSRPTPRPKASNKPYVKTSRAPPAARKTPAARPTPQPAPATRPLPGASQPRTVPVPQPAVTNGFGHARNESTASTSSVSRPAAAAASAAMGARAPPPPPPPVAAPVAAPSKPMYRALYPFSGQSANELTIVKDELVEIITKEENGWWLAKKQSSDTQGWVPTAYLKEETPPPPAASTARVPPPPPPTNGLANPSNMAAGLAAGLAARTKPAAPTPPAKRPIGKKPVPTPGAEVNGSTNSEGSRAPSMAGGLAEALRARQQKMTGQDEEEDWD